MRQHYPVYTVTPHGILKDNAPLTKAAGQDVSPQSLGYLRLAEEILAKVKPEDWHDRTPHLPHEIRPIAKAAMLAALASPQPFPPSLEKAGFDPDQPRDWHGRWTDGDGSFASLANHYPTYKQYPSESAANGQETIWELIGGNVKYNYDHGTNFNNSCAIRISYALNNSGFPIPHEKGETISGKTLTEEGDKTWYYFRTEALSDYLNRAYGKAYEYTPDTWKDKVKGQTGIAFFKVPFSDASGHMELFDGKKILNYDDPDPNAHHDYTDRATRISFWPIK